jgi:hypothetical protein
LIRDGIFVFLPTQFPFASFFVFITQNLDL